MLSFGDTVKLLHPFDKPFTGESGAFIVSQFQFKQQKTQWAQMLDGVIRILDHAKSTSSSHARDEHLQCV